MSAITEAPNQIVPPAPRLADFCRTDKATLISPEVLRPLVRTLDWAVTAAIGFAIALLYVDEPSILTNPTYLIGISFTSLVAIAAMEVLALYSLQAMTSALTQMPRVVLAWVIAFSVLLMSLFFMKAGADVSRAWLGLWFSAGAFALVVERLMLATKVRTWHREGNLYRRAVVFGTGDVARAVLDSLENDDDSDIRISGLFDARVDDRAPLSTLGYPLLGDIDDLEAFVRNKRVDVIIVALPVTAEKRIDHVLRRLAQLPVDIKIPASATPLRFAPSTYSRIGSVPMLDLIDKPMSNWGRIAKSIFDKTIAAIALVLLAPVLAAIAIAVKFESKGPVLFRQKRYGYNNNLVEVLKFRSMYTDMCDKDAANLVTKGDPRVTGIGRIIRKTSLDELPQLLNVLRGDLSLVGPRPHALKAKAADKLYDDIVEGYFARHKVKPGITGWAQINGWRGETDTAEKIQKRVEHDLYYIENWSVFLDLYILIMTPLALAQTQNAY